jgi:uncharacterized membrane protein
MWIGMLAFVGVLVWVGYTLMTSAARERRNGAGAREVLDGRLARGEIDGAEYRALRSLIATGDDS